MTRAAACVLLVAAAVSFASLARAQSFPQGTSRWLVVTRGGTAIDDPWNDGVGERDVLGGPGYPAAYVARNFSHLFFRLRVAEDPTAVDGASLSSAWGAALDTDLDVAHFEFLAMAKDFDAPEDVALLDNSAPGIPDDARDVAETQTAAYPGASYLSVERAPTTVSGVSSYFVSWAIRAEALPLTGPIRLFFGTSSSGDRFDGDLFGGDSESISEILSDPVNCSGATCVSCATACGEECLLCDGTTPVCNAEAGVCEACDSDRDCLDPAAPRCEPDGACHEADPNVCVPTDDMLCDPESIRVTGGACDYRAAPGSDRSATSFAALALALGALGARRRRRTTLRE